MVYRSIADIILIIHFCFILFVIVGGFFLLRWRKLWKLHLPAVIWGFMVQYFVWICPLTNMENYFRNLSGQAGYDGGFIEHFTSSLIYPNVAPEFHLILGFLLLLINASIYFYIFLLANKLR